MTQNITLELTADGRTLTAEPKTCVIKNAVCNDSLQHEESTVTLSLNYDEELFALITLQNDIQAVLKDGINTVFTGLLNTDLS